MTFFSKTEPYVKTRGVHLDLKGLPPTPERMMQILDLLNALRINCILVEWEDAYSWSTFPELQSRTAYSEEFVGAFVKKAVEYGMMVIPLIQSFGHLENLLGKKRLKYLREDPAGVRDLCPLNPDSYHIITSMIDDVLRTHEGAINYFHLGGDEVYVMGHCDTCKQFLKSKTPEELYMKHMVPLFDYLNSKNIKPIIWDDMMHGKPKNVLDQIAHKAELMMWCYGSSYFPEVVHENYPKFKDAGIKQWGASAFKGVDGGNADLLNIENRISCFNAWNNELEEKEFEGIVATGWSRYLAFSVQCQSIEVSLASLTLAAASMWDGCLPENAYEKAVAFLHNPELNEIAGQVYDRCLKSAENLSQWREQLYSKVQFVPHLAHVCGEPERYNVMWTKELLSDWKSYMREGEKRAADWLNSHRGLVHDWWLQKYIESRLWVCQKIDKTVFTEITGKEN